MQPVHRNTTLSWGSNVIVEKVSLDSNIDAEVEHIINAKLDGMKGWLAGQFKQT